MTLAHRRAGTLPRVISLITLAAFLPSSFGCTSWRAVPIRQVQFDKEKLVNKRVRFYLRHDATTYNVDYHVVEMVVEEIAFPIVRGIQDVSGGTEHLSWSERRPGTEVRSVSVDLGDVSAVEIWSGEGWRPGPFTQARTEAQRLVGERARFYLRLEAATYDINRGVVEMVVREVDFPIVRGNRVHPQGKDRSNANAPSEAASIDSVSVNLIDVSRVAVWQADDHWRSCFIILGVTAAIFAILFIVAMATKESCPIVYVEGEGGYQLVGEAYAGAVFRSIQRPDLLPLPQLPTGHASLILANEARETQYTDLIELVVADHAPGTRAVSTEDQEIMLVSDAAPPLRAVDFQDEDVTTQVTTSDDDVWQTDLSQFVDAAAPPLLESLVATFPRPRAGERPVLELVVANTYYYDVVFGRFFALMGGRSRKVHRAGQSSGLRSADCPVARARGRGSPGRVEARGDLGKSRNRTVGGPGLTAPGRGTAAAGIERRRSRCHHGESDRRHRFLEVRRDGSFGRARGGPPDPAHRPSRCPKRARRRRTKRPRVDRRPLPGPRGDERAAPDRVRRAADTGGTGSERVLLHERVLQRTSADTKRALALHTQADPGGRGELRPLRPRSLSGILRERRRKRRVPDTRAGGTMIVSGFRRRTVKLLVWSRVTGLTIRRHRNPVKAARELRSLRTVLVAARGAPPARKYAKVSGRYFSHLYTPGWPAESFDRYVGAELDRALSPPPPATLATGLSADDELPATRLQTIILGITKKCPLRCQHCYEWDRLNDPDTVSAADIATIVDRFQTLGVTQIQFSGGEPLQRAEDMIGIVKNARPGTDFWILTSGVGLTPALARRLKDTGFTGICISLDHWKPEAHDAFRGLETAFDWASRAGRSVRDAGLVLCLTLCPTREFVGSENLRRYAELAKNIGAHFIEILEPRAVGRFAGMDVALRPAEQAVLDRFFLEMNFDPVNVRMPIVIYPGFSQRRRGCYGAGLRYLYVDPDAQIHACPFCRKPMGSALDPGFERHILALRREGCAVFECARA